MKLFILGAGGHARETYFHVKDIDPNIEILFIDDFSETKELILKGEKISVIKSWSEVKDLKLKGFDLFTIGIGTPIHKESFIKKAVESGLRPAKTWIHPKALVQDAQVGLGGMIAPGAIVTCNVKIGQYVTLNYNTSIGHDSILEDYVSCNPGSCISGNVTIGKGSLIGAGAVVREKIKIASYATVGAQACVVKDIINDKITVIGVPAKEY